MNFLDDKEIADRQQSRSPCSLTTEVVLPTTFLASGTFGKSTSAFDYCEKDLSADPFDISEMEKSISERRRSSKDQIEQYLGAIDPTFDGQNDVHSIADLLFNDENDTAFPLGCNEHLNKENETPENKYENCKDW